MSFNVGDRVGDYRIIDVLGAGGMGKVYKVQNVISERVDAMKVLLPNLASEPELADRFLREIKVLASLNHPNIASLYTAFRSDNQLIMVMEFVEGTTLEQMLQRGPLPLPDAIDFIGQVLSALSYAHARGVVHRDIKPANMMLTPQGSIKLMDFGIAKTAGDRRLTMTGTTLGSLYYMSPEQIQGQPLDGRADLYSVGVSLYELVTGVRPFRAKSDYELMVAHLQAAPLPPIQLDPNLPPALNDIILTALAKDPGRRFQSADAFRNAVQAVKSSLAQEAPVAAGPATQVFGRAEAGGATPGPPPVPVATPSPPPPPPVSAAGGRRGLYMALGAVLGILVLAIAATQLPRWLKTKAGGTRPVTTQEISPPATAEQTPGTDLSEQHPESQLPSASGTQPGQADTSWPPASATQGQAGTPSLDAFKAPPSPAEQPRGAKKKKAPRDMVPPVPSTEEMTAPPSGSTPGGYVAAPDAAQVQQETRERMISLAARANAVRSSLQNLERQQAARGLSLRGDIASAWNRMESFMDDADAAWKARELELVKRNLNLAERELETLERFLGR